MYVVILKNIYVYFSSLKICVTLSDVLPQLHTNSGQGCTAYSEWFRPQLFCLLCREFKFSFLIIVKRLSTLPFCVNFLHRFHKQHTILQVYACIPVLSVLWKPGQKGSLSGEGFRPWLDSDCSKARRTLSVPIDQCHGAFCIQLANWHFVSHDYIRIFATSSCCHAHPQVGDWVCLQRSHAATAL